MKKYIVFTDLDGTLLDYDTYRFDAASKAIDFLKRNHIPIIPCTSKTHQEVIRLRKKLDIFDPFIVENGSAIFYPSAYFKNVNWTETKFGEYCAHILGKSYEDILHFLNVLKLKYRSNIRGFSQMELEEISKLTNLDVSEAHEAKERFFSEPFVLNNSESLPEEIEDEIKDKGFRLLRGNRFHHLLGNSDKGRAVLKLTEMFDNQYEAEKPTTIGIGDSMNDLEMLQNVDYPVLVKKQNGQHQNGINLSNIIFTNGIGPEGWNEAIFQLVKE